MTVHQSEAVLLAVVGHLLDDESRPALLLALGPAAAVVQLPDGSITVFFGPGFGPPDALGERMQQFVTEQPQTHFKFVLLGGAPALREQFPAGGGGLLSRRAVQLFHLTFEGADGSLWTGGGAREDSPVGQALIAAGERRLPIPTRAAIAERVEQIEVTPEQRAAASEHRSFIEGLAVRPLVSWVLAAMLLVLFGLEQLWGGSTTIPTLVRMGGNTGAAWAEPWRWVSSAVLHAGFLHIGVNTFVLWVLGGFVEKLLGGGRYALLLLVSALGGSIASTIMSEATVAVGASGAIWGVLGAAVALAWRPGSLVPESVVPALRRNALVNLLINLSVSFLPEVDLWAHLGGGAAGALLIVVGLTRGAARPGTPEYTRGQGPYWSKVPWACAAVVALSLGVGWSIARPWELVQPPRWVDYPLAENLTLRVPAALTPPRTPPGQADGTTWLIGDEIGDPLWLAVTRQPHDYDRQAALAWIDDYSSEGPQLPPDVEVVRPWTSDETASLPTFITEYRYPSGVHSGLWVQLRPTDVLSIEYVRAPNVPAHWDEALPVIYASAHVP